MLQSFNRKLSPLDWPYQELYSDTKRLSVAKSLMQLHLIDLTLVIANGTLGPSEK